jgi:ATP-dependent DNA helicase HFM1/MER3
VVFRELNKSPLILHPIRETVALTWHKISMIVQIDLGGVEIPTDAEAKIFRQDFLREKRMVFDRLNRLVRCLTDCKASDGDGPGTNAALELARSIAAHAWENKPAQLAQIKGFGPVAVRKWVSHGVRTVLGVADKSVFDIERIASRNPPYGHTLQKQLEDFPRLTLKVDVIESRARSRQASDPVSVTISAHLGHVNVKPVPCWNDRAPALTFIALNSNGYLAFLWRGNMRQIGKFNGIDLKFPVSLTAANETISCYFSCEEIVGTQVIKILEPNIPASTFHSAKNLATDVNRSGQDLVDSEEVYEGVSDEAMLEALKSPALRTADDYSDSAGDEGEEFPLIDEILSQDDTCSGYEPAKMDNGRYVCNHKCSNGRLTKSGKPCSHICCREGVDKYRPPKKPKNSSCTDSTRESEDKHNQGANTPQASAPRKKHDEKKKNLTISAPTTEALKTKVDNDRDNRLGSPRQGPKRKHVEPPVGAGDPRVRAPKRPKQTCGSQTPKSASDMEYIDLCNTPNDGPSSPIIRGPGPSASRVRRGKLLVLHEKVNGPGSHPQRLTKSHDMKPKPNPGKENHRNSDGESAIQNHGTSGICTSTEDDMLSDIYDDMSDLPELEELLCIKTNAQPPDSKEVAPPQLGPASDETLYPGVVNTLKESMNYG